MPQITIYARKSTESEDRQALSIESQIAELASFAHGQGLEIDKIYKEARSAKTTGRPEFSRMLKEIRKKPGSIVLTWSLDRLARNLQDAATLSQYLQDGIISEIRTPRVSYGNTSMDLFISGLDFLIAKKYVDDLSENVSRGMRQKVRLGWFPGRPCLGYITSGPYRRGLRIVSPDPKTFDRVQKLWLRLVENPAPVTVLVQYAASLGISISLSGLHRLLRNPFYYGQFLWNGELHVGKHKPMISFDQYQKVQKYLHRNRTKKQMRHNFTFTGLITCGECGCAVTAEEKSKLIKASGKIRHYTYYHCTRKGEHPCRQPSITEQELSRQIKEYLTSLGRSKGRLLARLSRLQMVQPDNVLQSYGASDTHKLQEVDRQIQELLTLWLCSANEDRSLLTETEYRHRKNELVTQRQNLKERALTLVSKRKETEGRLNQALSLANSGLEKFSKGEDIERKQILRDLGTRRQLIDKKLMINRTW